LVLIVALVDHEKSTTGKLPQKNAKNAMNSGFYHTTSDVIATALDLLRVCENAEQAAYSQKIHEAIDQSKREEVGEFNLGQFLKRMRAQCPSRGADGKNN